ncbi:hypothetical protein [Winogradskyella ouciana]|uniref:hypothetical protein n=1 Tax=Winogradskyella ouciana TaxID=2608631 RepID=UPI003D2E5826
MRSWLSNLIKKFKSPEYDYKLDLAERRRHNVFEILNTSLSLAMEFGPNLNKPLNSRLKRVYPELSRRERKGYNKLAYEITHKGRDYMFDYVQNIKTNEDYDLMKEKFAKEFRLYNTWISDKNIDMLFNQACYYASK